MMKLELQPLDINRFIKEIANDFIDYARQRNIDFQILCDENMPTDVYIDKNIVEKIVMNLLNNAFKYTPDRGSIILETYSKRRLPPGYGNRPGTCKELGIVTERNYLHPQ